MADEINAKPCPFCGCGVTEFGGNDSADDVTVQCADCLAEGPVATIGCRDDDDEAIDLEREAVDQWNRAAGANEVDALKIKLARRDAIIQAWMPIVRQHCEIYGRSQPLPAEVHPDRVEEELATKNPTRG